MGRLDHEHIVPVHSVVFQPETRLRGLIMPYRPGLPLDEVIRRVNPTSRPRSARVLWDVVAAAAPTDAQALDGHPGWGAFPMRGTYAQGVAWIIGTLAGAVAYAHAREIHHRDIKPANVLLTLHHGPQLLDFNLAYDPHAAEQAEAALRGGTLPYMAPEQLEAFIDPCAVGRRRRRRRHLLARPGDVRAPDGPGAGGPRPVDPPAPRDPRLARPPHRSAICAPAAQPGHSPRPRGDRSPLPGT